MMNRIIVLALVAALMSGCYRSTLTGYNIKGNVGQTTDMDSGKRTLFTGASIDGHFDVRCQQCHSVRMQE